MIIKLLIEGGDMKPGPAIAQQLGPMGINMGKVISDVNSSTKEFKGMKVPVELDVDKKTKEFHIKVFSPPASELIRKELKLEKGSAKIKEIKVGNASIEDIIKVAKIKHSNMLEKEFKSAVKSILGTCAAMGILVEDKEPNELMEDVVNGKFDKEINQKLSETTTDKRNRLEDYYKKVKTAQDMKAEQAKKAAEEAEAAKAAATAAAPAAGAAAAAPKTEGAKAGAGSASKPTAAAKPAAEKKK
ncbi:50S ribosomal protein L11 [uncultured archaeon]|nr:50S ribosomal protein L11 [uncultured archaeon]